MIKRVLTMASIASLLAACGGGGGNTANLTNNANTAPRATNPTIVLQPTSNTALVAPRVALRGASSAPQIGDTLKAEYTYEDSDNDPQGATTFRWLRDGTAIAGATQQTYKLTVDDAGKTISVEITPVATSGVLSGSATASAKVVNTTFTPKDPLMADQWYIKNTGTAPSTWGQYTDLTKDADLRVQEAWKLGFTGEGIVTTVVDNGLDFTHPDLKPREESGLSYSQDKTNPNSAAPPTATTKEQYDHGTSVAGIIGANSDTVGVVGIAPKTKLIGHRILDIPEANKDANAKSAYIKILEDKVSQVSNHSYGDDDNGVLYPQSNAVYKEILTLVTTGNNGKGHTMLFAAGNGRANKPDTTTPSKSNYGDYAGLDMSQQHPYVLSISGFDANDKDVTYAEAGPATLVAGATGDRNPAEGVDPTPSGTKKPAAAMATTGRTDFDYAKADNYHSHRTKESKGYNMAFNGTSAATPSVTGIAALLLSTNTQRPANSPITWRDVRWILAKTARKIQSGKRITDQTTLNEDATSRVRETTIWEPKTNDNFGEWSHYFGFGAANAEAALKMALDNYTPLPALKQCDITQKRTSAGITYFTFGKLLSDCPKTVEFVQVAYTVKANADINNLQLSMQTSGADDSDKRVYLINTSTCSNKDKKEKPVTCKPSADTAVKGGTVAFMGDTAPTTKRGYKFRTEVNGVLDGLEQNIAITGVTIYGH